MAKLHQVIKGDTAEGLEKQEYGASVRDGHDLRYYENVLLHVNKQHNRAGITGSYQDPNIRGGGSNNVQLVAGHRIWLVSPAYAKALESVIPDGSLTGGAIAKVKRVLPGPLIDIIRSVIEAPDHVSEVVGEYAQAIREHQAEIFGIVLGFLVAELSSAVLAILPGGQIAAAMIQLVLAAYGAAQAIQAAAEALRHAIRWLQLAWTAQGNAKQIGEASKEFLRMFVSIIAAVLSYLGVKGNFGTAVKLARSMPPGAVPALAVVGGGTGSLGGAGTAVAVGPSTGSLGAFAAQMSKHNDNGGGSSKEEGSGGTLDESGPKIPDGLDKRLTKLVKDVIQRARNSKLLKSGNYHAHFDDATVLQILKDADAIYQSEGKASRLIFRKGNDIVVVEGLGSGQGSVITGYGPSGIKGGSGAAALGGAASDAGAPITDAMIKNGTIPVPQGRPLIPKAVQIAP